MRSPRVDSNSNFSVFIFFFVFNYEAQQTYVVLFEKRKKSYPFTRRHLSVRRRRLTQIFGAQHLARLNLHRTH
jgi:hypothetical protein